MIHIILKIVWWCILVDSVGFITEFTWFVMAKINWIKNKQTIPSYKIFRHKSYFQPGFEVEIFSDTRKENLIKVDVKAFYFGHEIKMPFKGL